MIDKWVRLPAAHELKIHHVNLPRNSNFKQLRKANLGKLVIPRKGK
jgi:hypothetical protein